MTGIIIYVCCRLGFLLQIRVSHGRFICAPETLFYVIGFLFIPACFTSVVQPDFQETASGAQPHLLSEFYYYCMGQR